MKTIKLGLFGGALGGALAALSVACFNDADDCRLNAECLADGTVPPKGGASNGGNGTGGNSTGGAGGDNNGGDGGSSASGGDGSGGNPAGGTGGGASGGNGGAGGTGGGCEAGKDPDQNGCLTDVVYASPAATEAGDGTKAKPFASLSAAITAAGAGKKRVVACADDSRAFAESVEVTADGVTVWGGFDCGSWAYQAGAQTKVSSPTALGMKVTSAKLTLVDVEVTASDATDAGGNSVALWASGSEGLTLKRVVLTAGKGKAGVGAAVEVVDFSKLTPTAPAEAGDTTSGVANGCELQCPSGETSVGGGGARKGVTSGNGAATSGSPGDTVNAGTGTCTSPVGIGGNGADGSVGTPGAGPSTRGTLSASGWVPAKGTDGAVGKPGQGGGGGASSETRGGGGGGCGGCGGAGSPGASGGGASVALLLQGSKLTTDAVEFTSVDAGNGGNASTPQSGMTADLANEIGPQGLGACVGGAGGAGGPGGRGGGGAGGVSVGILHDGTAPTVDAKSTFKLGKAGAAGAGGGTAAAAGVAQNVLNG